MTVALESPRTIGSMRRHRFARSIGSLCVGLCLWPAAVRAGSADAACAGPDLAARFAPSGRLRATINLGNPILAGVEPGSPAPHGVSVDLSEQLARRIGVELQLEVVDAAGKAVAAVTTNDADIGFFAIDPVRGAGIAFTAPYLTIEGAYLVRADSPIASNADVDRKGNRVVVGKDSAYDLYLTRELHDAAIVRAPTSPSVTDTFVREGAQVAAGVRQQMQADSRRVPGLRLLDGRFMVIEQAMGVSKGRGNDVAACLAAFVEEMKATGFVQRSLDRHRIDGASVAEPAVTER